MTDLTLLCDLTELPQATCAHCRRLPDPPELRRHYGRTFTSVRAGRCAECDHNIAPGDRIRNDGEGGYVHADCADAD